MILAIKLIVTPIFIGVVTLAGRKWGPSVSGMLMGLPLTSGPISVFLALQYGAAFAAHSAAGNLAGLVSVCFFCLVYCLAALRTRWPISLVLSLGTFFLATFIWNQFSLTLLAATLAVAITIPLVLLLMPRGTSAPTILVPPHWDLPARIIIATAFVLALTEFANRLGPGLSGLLAPLPIYSCVFAAFTHHLQGPRAAAGLLRGVVGGSLAYTFFFVVTGSLLTRLSIGWTYLLASIAAVCVSAFAFYLLKLTSRTRS
jgi:hypothetical protein